MKQKSKAGKILESLKGKSKAAKILEVLQKKNLSEAFTKADEEKFIDVIEKTLESWRVKESPWVSIDFSLHSNGILPGSKAVENLLKSAKIDSTLTYYRGSNHFVAEIFWHHLEERGKTFRDVAKFIINATKTTLKFTYDDIKVTMSSFRPGGEQMVLRDLQSPERNLLDGIPTKKRRNPEDSE